MTNDPIKTVEDTPEIKKLTTFSRLVEESIQKEEMEFKFPLFLDAITLIPKNEQLEAFQFLMDKDIDSYTIFDSKLKLDQLFDSFLNSLNYDSLMTLYEFAQEKGILDQEKIIRALVNPESLGYNRTMNFFTIKSFRWSDFEDEFLQAAKNLEGVEKSIVFDAYFQDICQGFSFLSTPSLRYILNNVRLFPIDIRAHYLHRFLNLSSRANRIEKFISEIEIEEQKILDNFNSIPQTEQLRVITSLIKDAKSLNLLPKFKSQFTRILKELSELKIISQEEKIKASSELF